VSVGIRRPAALSHMVTRIPAWHTVRLMPRLRKPTSSDASNEWPPLRRLRGGHPGQHCGSCSESERGAAVRIRRLTKYRVIAQPAAGGCEKHQPAVPYLITLRLDPCAPGLWPDRDVNTARLNYFATGSKLRFWALCCSAAGGNRWRWPADRVSAAAKRREFQISCRKAKIRPARLQCEVGTQYKVHDGGPRPGLGIGLDHWPLTCRINIAMRWPFRVGLEGCIRRSQPGLGWPVIS